MTLSLRLSLGRFFLQQEMLINSAAALTLRPWVSSLAPALWVASQAVSVTSLPRASLAAWPPPAPPPLRENDENSKRQMGGAVGRGTGSGLGVRGWQEGERCGLVSTFLCTVSVANHVCRSIVKPSCGAVAGRGECTSSSPASGQNDWAQQVWLDWNQQGTGIGAARSKQTADDHSWATHQQEKNGALGSKALASWAGVP